MKFPVILMFLALFLIAGCTGGDKTNKKSETEISHNDTKNLQPKQEIKGNLSMIEGEILGNYEEDETDYVLKMRTSVVAKVDPYENIAVLGEEIFLTPSFVLDEKSEIAEEPVNKRLKELSKVKKGTTVRIHAFYVLKKGWFIKDYLIKN